MSMPKIVPHLWFDQNAEEAVQFYTSIFPDSSIKSRVTLRNTPSGDAMMISFNLAGQPFMAITGGPYFRFNPSVSFFVNFDPSRDDQAREHLLQLWEQLSVGGTVLMPLQEYPFSKLYGWIQDKFGLSWQLILTNPEGEERPNLIPCLLFVQDMYGKAEEAINFYLSVFKNSRLGHVARTPAGMEPGKEGTLMFGDFMLENVWFAAMDGPGEHNYKFNEAVSFMVRCENQAEIDDYWDKLSAVPEAEQCGWLKDKFGLSWQIVPAEMNEMMENASEEQLERITQAFLKMKRLDIEKLKKAAQI
jgi:predicted 3-demethylubiquinone-9 3-methyltransferase (glyoxalase superfamily)